MLFEPIELGKLELSNRFVRSATHEWMAEPDGSPTERLGELYSELARNRVGLIITGYAYVNPQGKSDRLQQGIYDDRFIASYKELVFGVHRYKSKIVMQISHGGRQTMLTAQNPMLFAPSAVTVRTTGITPEEMTEDEVFATIDDFANAARRAKESGFDGVQLHCAHGFLLSSFISPYTNRRTDRWGGSTEKRVQIIVDIINRIREITDDRDFPIMVKMNATDGFPKDKKNVLDAPECVDIAKILAASGVCAIEVSGGIVEASDELFRTKIKTHEEEAYYRDYSKMIKEAVDIPVILVGGLRSKVVMDKMLSEKYADMISLCRPLICEPELVENIYSGKTDIAKCVSCNLCSDESGIKCNYDFED